MCFCSFLYYMYTCFYLWLLLYFNISPDVIIDFNFCPRINRQYIHTNQTFRGMSPNISKNVAKHSGECCQTFRGMSLYSTGNVLKHSWECCQTFCGIFFFFYSGECPQTFRGMSPNIPGKVAKHSGECHYTLRGMSSNIKTNVFT